MYNATGAASVKGTLVEASSTVDLGFALCDVGSNHPIGLVYDAGIADGQLCRVVVSGLAEALIEASDTIVRGYWARTGRTTSGRVTLDLTAGGGSIAEHFKEVGHNLQTKSNTGNTLSFIVVHFN